MPPENAEPSPPDAAKTYEVPIFVRSARNGARYAGTPSSAVEIPPAAVFASAYVLPVGIVSDGLYAGSGLLMFAADVACSTCATSTSAL